LEAWGGISDILLTHRDDVADAHKYADAFKARVWIHRADSTAAPFATNMLEGMEVTAIDDRVLAIPVPGHTQGSVVYLLNNTYLFTGDSLSWNFAQKDLQAFKNTCWFDWGEQKKSLGRLVDFDFEWVLAGHGGNVNLPVDDMHARLTALVTRM
jgi:glyoxylase-like metal-dependent hydrolase (beta-lactamase superfamily II)